MIERVITNHLIEDTALEKYMAKYDGQSAVFNQEAPGDMDSLWEGEQYPRIVVGIDMTEDPERGINGIMAVDISCETDKRTPEEIEPIVKPLLDGFFFVDNSETISAHWRASNYFTEPPSKVSGVTLTFNLYSYPMQETREPDPVRLLNKYVKELYPKAFVIGHDTPEKEAWKPSNSESALYWRLKEIGPCSYIHDIYSCIYRTATLQLHIMTDDKGFAASIARHLDYSLSTKKRLIFPDKGPFTIDSAVISPGSNVQQIGQFMLTGTYGELRPEVPVNPLENIEVTGLI